MLRGVTVFCKPLWTAPEVAEGRKPDRRADLYALGLLFWYLLSGRNPEGDLDSPSPSLPPPSTFNPEVSASLDESVMKAVHPNPDRRFQTAQEFQEILAPLMPEGYQGSKELARLVVGYQLVRENDYFAALVAGARPLLDQISPTRISFSKRKALLVASISTVAILAIGLPLLLGGKVNQHAVLALGTMQLGADEPLDGATHCGVARGLEPRH